MGDKYSVYLHRERPRLVGTLWLNQSKGRLSSAFSYAPAWLQAPQGFALSPDLPLDQYPKACEGLFLCFQDCSPDRWGKVLLRRQESALADAEKRKPRTLLDSDFLLRVNDVTRQGAIRLSADEGKSFLAESGVASVPPLLSLPKLLSAAQNIDARTETETDLKVLVAPGSSLGGARPKASVLGKNGELLIAKFPSRNDDRDIPLWEYVTFKLARRARIRSPEVQLQKVAGKNVLLVQRFDRRGTERIPFISAMSLLEARDGDHMSYVDIASVLQAEGSAPVEDLHELWSRMVFNMCVYNVDDHLRNHGFLREPLGWRLSPVYDLETSHPTEKTAYLHTAIIEDRSAFSLDDALEAAEFFRFRKSEAQKCLAEIREAVSHWRQEATHVKAAPSEIRFMRDAFEYL
ncbi:MAG: type II toxin-antitoxin system HipA family toxin [Desulfovibrio sp.]|nr:type II toxin-antitoxin system HipA family toxin [Desulfovibrio sp.]